MILKDRQGEDVKIEVTVKIKGKTEKEFYKGIVLHEGQPLIYTGGSDDQSVHKYVRTMTCIIERTLLNELGAMPLLGGRHEPKSNI